MEPQSVMRSNTLLTLTTRSNLTRFRHADPQGIRDTARELCYHLHSNEYSQKKAYIVDLQKKKRGGNHVGKFVKINFSLYSLVIGRIVYEIGYTSDT